MTAAADSLRAFVAPLLPGWRVQFGRWVEGTNPADRYCVIRPAGGLPSDLVREPQFTLALIGAVNADADVPSGAADTIITSMKAGTGQGLVTMNPGEPSVVPTSDGRPVIEFAVSAITN